MPIADHHERWDGNRLPEGHAGEDISLAGRIVAVADVFDVITSARSYKESGTAITAREEIARCAGEQFDPRVVRAFLSISLGRLRLAMGPLSWLAQAPVLGRIPLGPGMATAVELRRGRRRRARRRARLRAARPDATRDRPRRRQRSPSVQVASGGRLAEAARVLPGRRGGKARTPAPAPVAAPVLNELLAALPVPGDPTPPEGPVAAPPARPHPRRRPCPHPRRPPAARPAAARGPVVRARRRSERQRGRRTAARPRLGRRDPRPRRDVLGPPTTTARSSAPSPRWMPTERSPTRPPPMRAAPRT